MKKQYIVLIVVVAVVATINLCIISPLLLFWGGTIYDSVLFSPSYGKAEIQIDSYRLCKDQDGDDIIVIQYLLKNKGKEPTTLYYEGEFLVYQNGVSLNECVDELPKECDYDLEDQYKNVKGGNEYYAEIAYELDSFDDVEVEVIDYGFFDTTKEKVFTIQ